MPDPIVYETHTGTLMEPFFGNSQPVRPLSQRFSEHQSGSFSTAQAPIGLLHCNTDLPVALPALVPRGTTYDEESPLTSNTSSKCSTPSSWIDRPLDDRQSMIDAHRDEFVANVELAGCSEDPGFRHELMMYSLGFKKPPRFAQVLPGLWRSSYPDVASFRFLKSLSLKTILTLVPYTNESSSFLGFISEQGINHIRIELRPNKVPFESIAEEDVAQMERALSLLLCREAWPLLVHCNKGKHRTGTLIACLRKVFGWDSRAIVNEYRHYAGAKYRELDEKFLGLFDVSKTRESASELALQFSSDVLPESSRDEQLKMRVRFPEDKDIPQRQKEKWKRDNDVLL